MKTFLEPLGELNEYQAVEENLRKGITPIHLTGCIDSQKCHMIYGLGSNYPFKVIVTHNELKAKEIYEDYKLYEKDVFIYPAKDVIFYSADIHGQAIVKERLNIFKRIAEGIPTTIITTIDGGMDYCLPLAMLQEKKIILKENDTVDVEKIREHLVYLGYENVTQVEGAGQFSVRGGIIDVYPMTEEVPYRMELWGDEIDTIRTFDVESQRSIDSVSEIVIYPATEIFLNQDQALTGFKEIEKEKERCVAKLRKEMKTEEAHRLKQSVEQFKETYEAYNGIVNIDSYIHYFYQNTVSFFDYFSEENSLFIFDEPNRVLEKGEAVELEFRESMMNRLEKGYILPGQMNVLYSVNEVIAKCKSKKLLLISTMDTKMKNLNAEMKYSFTVQSIQSYNNNFEVLVKDIERWKKNGYRVLLLSASETRGKRMCDDLKQFDINAFYRKDLEYALQQGEVMVSSGSVHKGFEYPLIKFVVVSESDIFGGIKKKKKKRKSYEGIKINSFQDLKIGDYVVHENHGLGVYRGIEKIEVDKITKDYIKIEYADGGNLYILATGLDVIQKYAGSEAKKPKLNKLNSTEWKKTKSRVRGAVQEIARELVELYAKRQEKQGFSFGSDTVWQQEFEEMFPYEETDDQLNAIEQTKKDMESKKIMDRLICGDVGYGKTEIAIRAAFKAVLDGKQVAFLVPTTILAQQHYNTFVQRMMNFPVSVDVLSRFRTAAEQKKALERLRKGSLDILIGTHRLLSKDLEFKDLGLLIVDEEQRFGVTHKEKIKQLKSDIDVLTLSATPIPRTLHMSLVGIRDMSVLEEPPVDRTPIQTFVLEHNEEMIREAILRELSRNGQVYYVYNRVNNMDYIANDIAKLVPEASVAFAHGQMRERELERIMFDFINGNIDVLVSTTIVETGLDIPNVNTIIIDDADRLGLSQLYQLRGRVGRSNRTAYAFLMYKKDKMLREIAEKRLQAIKEFTDLGSGFKIAMRDLEIRGAGNLLGAKQHGHMEAVGYDLYCKMLNEAVKSLKGELTEEENYDTTVEFDVDAYIPPSYIKSEFQKLEIYKRVAEIENEEELLDMYDELVDRFGEPPKSVENLLQIALIKSMAHKARLIQVTHKGNEIKFIMYQKASVDINKIPQLITNYQGKMKFTPDSNPYFTYYLNQKMKMTAKDLLDICKDVIVSMMELIDDKGEK